MSRYGLREYMARYGFVVESTGGGCEAYVRRIRDGNGEETGERWMMTAMADPSLPEQLDSKVDLGHYRDDEDEGSLWGGMTVVEATLAVTQLCGSFGAGPLAGGN